MNAQPLQPQIPSEQSFPDWLNSAFARQSPPITWEELAIRANWPLKELLLIRDGKAIAEPGVIMRLEDALQLTYVGDHLQMDPEMLADEAGLTMDEIIRRWFAAIPPEESRRLPLDGAAQHDHYIYGTPKRKDV